jgi:hypothetical protein
MIEFPPPKKISKRINRLFLGYERVNAERAVDKEEEKKEQEKKPSSFYQKES